VGSYENGRAAATAGRLFTTAAVVPPLTRAFEVKFPLRTVTAGAEQGVEGTAGEATGALVVGLSASELVEKRAPPPPTTTDDEVGPR
jgi:hypothetical protein